MKAGHKFFHLMMLCIVTVIAIFCYVDNCSAAEECDAYACVETIVTDTSDELKSQSESLALAGNTQTSFTLTSSLAKTGSRLVHKYRNWLGSSALYAKNVQQTLFSHFTAGQNFPCMLRQQCRGAFPCSVDSLFDIGIRNR